jgi:glycerate kinase
MGGADGAVVALAVGLCVGTVLLFLHLLRSFAAALEASCRAEAAAAAAAAAAAGAGGAATSAPGGAGRLFSVRNPLLGEHGASAVFGPQKGATPAMVAQLDAALARYAAVLHATTGCDAANLPGSGAAGGMGAAALAVLGGRMQAGIELVLDAAGLAAALQGADLVITGEGRLDGQSAFGKTPVGVATLAARHGVPTIAIGGALGDGVEALQQHHIRAVFACVDRITTLDAALGNAAANLARVAGNVGALLALGVGVSR